MRRSWADEEKRRIVEETLLPGASVAAVAQRHDINVDLLFSWRRQACGGGCSWPASRFRPQPSQPSFLPPIGAIDRAADERLATVAINALAHPSRAAVWRSAGREAKLDERPGVDGGPGVIEVDLLAGPRVRVDASVNERAYRR